MARILLVEAGANLRAMAGALVEAGFELAYEESVPEAIDRLGTYRPEVIVLHVAEPVEPLTLFAQLRASTPGVRILDVSPPHAAQPAAPVAAADAVLRPPFDETLLVDAIWRLVDQSPFDVTS